jgi:hypothetical protein
MPLKPVKFRAVVLPPAVTLPEPPRDDAWGMRSKDPLAPVYAPVPPVIVPPVKIESSGDITSFNVKLMLILSIALKYSPAVA